MTDEWRVANRRNNVIKVLKEAEIVSKEQATEIIELVTHAMNPSMQVVRYWFIKLYA